MLIAAILLATLSQADLPDEQDVDWARVARIHDCFGEGMVHCRRLEELKCRFTDTRRQLARCRYREWSERRPWVRKTITLRRVGKDWEWVSGDPPNCSITVIPDE